METIQVIMAIIGLVNTLMIFYLGTLEKRLSAMQAKLERTVDKEDVTRVVELEIKSVVNEQINLKEDLHRIEVKVDRLLDRLMK